MTEQSIMINSVAPLRNVASLVALTERVQQRTPGLPGIAVFYGYSGFGKTFAQTYARNVFQGFAVEVKSCWTKKDLVEAIADEMGVKPGLTVAATVKAISEALLLSDRPLFIDEADVLVNKKMIEIVRDIYEGTQASIILIGEELLPQKLQAWERFHGRVMAWEAAEPGCMDDVSHLAKIYARGIDISQSLKAKLLEASNLSIRRISTNLQAISEVARTEGLDKMSEEDWGGRSFFTGTPPQPRRFK